MAKPEDVIEQRFAELIATLKRTGVVTAIVGVKVTVALPNGSLTLNRLASYTPTVNDVVVVQGPPPYIVLGKPA